MVNHKGYRTYFFEASHCEKMTQRILPISGQEVIFGKAINPHGHNYQLVLGVEGKLNNKTSMIVELGGLDWIVKRSIIDILDHQDITDLFQLDEPTTNDWLVQYCVERLKEYKLISDYFSELYLYDTKRTCSKIIKGDNMVYRTIVFDFTAKHKLHNPSLSEEENIDAFGKCVEGHGHNYVLKITVKGTPNQTTNLLVVEHKFIEHIEKLLEYYDYSTLHKLKEFENKVATTEVFIEHLWTILKEEINDKIFYDSIFAPFQSPDLRLHCISLQETNRNIFTFQEEE